jgi:brefeldin A-inhibited guanine nucleotide-exchange protein
MKKVIHTGELEVRSKALSDLFEMLFENGHAFQKSFWITILNEIILPIFDEIKKDPTDRISEEQTVWISTTLVSAMRLLTDLYGTFHCLIETCLDSLLDLIMICILQENDTLARLGSSCLISFIEKNVAVFSPLVWDNILTRIVTVFDTTTPKELYFEVENNNGIVYHTPFNMAYYSKPTRKEFPKIIVKCVLHLIAIQTVQKILENEQQDLIFESFKRRHVFTLGDCLYRSYIFAQMFNDNIPLREALLKMGFMKTLPNLVKQETSACIVYLKLLSRMYRDKTATGFSIFKEIESRLLP